MSRDKSPAELDRELAELSPDLRWQEWMRRIEAVLFAFATPVARRFGTGGGAGAFVDVLIEDVADRPYEVARIRSACMLRTKAAYAPAIRAAEDIQAPEWPDRRPVPPQRSRENGKHDRGKHFAPSRHVGFLHTRRT